MRKFLLSFLLVTVAAIPVAAQAQQEDFRGGQMNVVLNAASISQGATGGRSGRSSLPPLRRRKRPSKRLLSRALPSEVRRNIATGKASDSHAVRSARRTR